MYNFDEIIDRSNTNALNTDGFIDYIFDGDDSLDFPYEKDEFIRMWVADMEFATPPEIREAIKERVDRKIFGYTRIFSDEYYESFSNWCQEKYDWTFNNDHLVTSNGIIPALFELVEYITDPDEKVLFLTPSYAYFKYAADHNHRDILCSDLIDKDNQFEINFDDLEKKASDQKTKMFIFCHPHNPTGRVWTTEELNKIATICRENDLWIISDEIHCDLLRVGTQHKPMGKIMPDYDQLVTCMAPSKTFNMAGLMISNIIIRDDDLRDLWMDRHYNFDNPLSVVGAQAAYAKGTPWLNELKVYLDENFKFTKDFLTKNLPKANFNIPKATYLAWVDVSAYFDGEVDLPMFFAMKAGVLLEGGDMFVQNSDGYIRLNLACPQSILAEGLERIAKAIKEK